VKSLSKYISGKSINSICKTLKAKNQTTLQGSLKWRPEYIISILTNEKYCGDVILQKTYAPDVMLKRRENLGQ
jgi:hypothetical protein